MSCVVFVGRMFDGAKGVVPAKVTADREHATVAWTTRTTWATEKALAEGTIKKLVSDRGFGFISQADGTEIFFHRSKVVGSFDTLSEGQKVSYEKAMDPRRNKENAEKVTPV